MCHFTAGGSTTQRSEAVNSTIRKNRKQQLTRMNIFQCLQHVSNLDDTRSQKAANELENILLEGRYWGTWVDRRLNDESRESYTLLVRPSSSGNLFIVNDEQGSHIVHEARVAVKVGVPPSCTCRIYTSNLLPCRHVAAVLSTLQRRFFDVGQECTD
jgi:SWIM zinc finger